MQHNAPTEITAGDTLDFLLHIPSHPPSAGWSLEFNLVLRTEGSALLLAAEPQGDAYRVQAGTGTTGTLFPGAHDWVAWVNGQGQSHTVARGQITVQPNPRNATRGLDSRSLAQRTLDSLLEAKARWDLGEGNQHRYRINEREMEFKSAAELERLIRFWEYRVYRESKPSSRFYLQAQ